MKKELTRETVEKYLNEARSNMWTNSKHAEELATALLEERAKPKVWDGAPDNATVAVVDFKRTCGDLLEPLSFEAYTRELPKTRARKNAEELYKTLCFQRTGKTDCINAIESALEKYAAELKVDK